MTQGQNSGELFWVPKRGQAVLRQQQVVLRAEMHQQVLCDQGCMGDPENFRFCGPTTAWMPGQNWSNPSFFFEIV